MIYLKPVRMHEGIQGQVIDEYVVVLEDDGKQIPLLRITHYIEYSSTEVPIEIALLTSRVHITIDKGGENEGHMSVL